MIVSMPLNIIQKIFVFGLWAEYYRCAAESVVSKLKNNYKKIEKHGRLELAKLAVDNIERLKGVLFEISKLKYKSIYSNTYKNLSYHLTLMQHILLTRKYGDNRPNAVRRIIEDLGHISSELRDFREDLTAILEGKEFPAWYWNVPSEKYKELSRKVSERYYKMFGEPMSVIIYLA